MLRNQKWWVKRGIALSWDLASWNLATLLAVELRFDFSVTDNELGISLLLGLTCSLLQIFLGFALHLYRGRYVLGSFDEVFGVLQTCFAITVTTFLFILFSHPGGYPSSVPLIAGLLAGLFMLAGRFIFRAIRERPAKNSSGSSTLIYGAGESASQLIALMQADSTSQFRPIGLIEDRPEMRRLRLHGVRVLGPIIDLEEIASQHDAQVLVVAITNIGAQRLRDLDQRCRNCGLSLRVLPTSSEILDGSVDLGDISDVTDSDLLGRRPIATNEAQIGDFLQGKRILITGAGGSIGSELARQVSRYQPELLAVLDRDESALHALQLSLTGNGLLRGNQILLRDIRDREGTRSALESTRPDIVFHAAALKHLALLERDPREAVATNVLGTLNVLEASISTGVKVFVNISTDKAADPSSVLGKSKYITERVTAGVMGKSAGSVYSSVRFGNVLGSRGSVLEAFRYQISRGGPLTVTHPDVTRYFMTIPEAVHLVLQAVVISNDGETLILDMGEPVRILDVAEYLVKRSGKDIKIEFTGLRPGEKLHESLVSTSEKTVRPFHPLISHTSVPRLQVERGILFDKMDNQSAAEWLSEICRS